MPADIALPDGGLFQTDIVMYDEHGAIYFIEVEREANKALEQCQSKWRNVYQAVVGGDT